MEELKQILVKLNERAEIYRNGNLMADDVEVENFTNGQVDAMEEAIWIVAQFIKE